MDHEEHVERTPICASVPHYAVALVVWWCPHRQQWFGGGRVHDEAGVVLDEVGWDWGPFDTRRDVQWHSAKWLEAQIAGIHGRS